MKKIQFFTAKKNKDGTTRYYWQPSAKWRVLGFPVTALPQEESAAKQKAVELNAELKKWAIRNTELVKPAELKQVVQRGSFDTLLSTYRMSPLFRDLAKNTKKDYEIRFKQLMDIFKGELVRTITPAVCYKFYEKQCALRGIPAANDLFKVFRRLLSFAMQPPLCLIDNNPASCIKMHKEQPRDSVWSTAALEAFLNTADRRRPAVALAVRLSVYTAQRQSDVLAMKWSDYKNGMISIVQQKTGTRVYVPIFGELKRILDTMPRNSIYIVTDINGQPFKSDHFKKLFVKVKALAQSKHPDIDYSNLKFIDLRRTAAVRMAEAGCTAFELSAVTGHQISQSQNILEVYAPRNAVMAQAAIHKLEQKFG